MFSRVSIPCPDECVGQIIYVGGFVLPDKNAAAQRVLSNAKLLRTAGYGVVFLNYLPDCSEPRLTNYDGFPCVEFPGGEWSPALGDYDNVRAVIPCVEKLRGIIAYNYPSFSFFRLISECRRRGLCCVADVTEWYSVSGMSLVKKAPKFLDTFVRMHILNRRCDALIVISDFLQVFYGSKHIINIPPLVDVLDEKWPKSSYVSNGKTSIVYAGVPSRTKERLDLICAAVQALSKEIPIELNIVGITQDDYVKIYGSDAAIPECANFYGRVSHSQVLEIVNASTYSIIVRDDNVVTRAGFPSKFAESIACGTPVLCNSNSCLERYVNDYFCGYLLDAKNLERDLRKAIESGRPLVDRGLFDYHEYSEQLRDFVCRLTRDMEQEND